MTIMAEPPELTTITVQAVIPPKPGRKTGSIKTSEELPAGVIQTFERSL